MVNASCHCGGVLLAVTHLPTTVTICNCSICYRLGALWGYFTAADVVITQHSSMNQYSRGGDELTFHTCSECGCTTHYTNAQKNGIQRVVINMRMVEPSITEAIPIRYFDGAVSWRYIE